MYRVILNFTVLKIPRKNTSFFYIIVGPFNPFHRKVFIFRTALLCSNHWVTGATTVEWCILTCLWLSYTLSFVFQFFRIRIHFRYSSSAENESLSFANTVLQNQTVLLEFIYTVFQMVIIKSGLPHHAKWAWLVKKPRKSITRIFVDIFSLFSKTSINDKTSYIPQIQRVWQT